MRLFFVVLFYVFGTLALHAQQGLNNTTPVPDSVKSVPAIPSSAESKDEAPATKATTVSSKKSKLDDLNSVEKTNALKETETLSSQKNQYATSFQGNLKASKMQSFQRTPTPGMQTQMQEATTFFQTINPEGYEANLFYYQEGNYNLDRISSLEAAAKLQPENNEVRTELLLANVILNNNEQADSLAKKLIESGKYSSGELVYSADLINSIPENSTLLVHGTTELIPAIYTRNQLKRYDLNIISIDLLQSPQYQLNVTNQGFNIPETSAIDTNFVKQFIIQNEQRNLFISMSFPRPYLQPIVSELVVYGLSFGYRIQGIDPFNWNLNVYNQLWNKQTLSQKQENRSDQLAANYLPCLLNLEKQFALLNRTADQQAVHALIQEIAVRAQRTKQMNQISH